MRQLKDVVKVIVNENNNFWSPCIYTHSWDYSALHQGSMCVEGGEGGEGGGGGGGGRRMRLNIWSV